MSGALGPDSRVGEYVIEAEIGRGGMGVVYRARQERLDRLVALKVIAPNMAQDVTFRGRFDRESRLAAAIEHPNAVPLYEAGEADGVVFIAMRLIDGTDLKALLRKDNWLEAERASNLIDQTAGALDAAHELGLVHRDVKPGNVLIGQAGNREWAYLTDFGLTKSMLAATELTESGKWMGTADYASPEQIEGLRVDGRSDIYSLAATAYELLTGAPPFDSPSLHGLMTAHMHHEPPSASARNRALPAGVDAVLARAIAKEPGRRHPTAGEFAAALADVFDSRATLIGPAIRPEPPTEPPTEPPAGTPVGPAPAGPEPSLGFRHVGAGVAGSTGYTPPPVQPGPSQIWPPDDDATQPTSVRRPRHLAAIGIVAVLVAGILGAGIGFARMSATSLDTPDPPDVEVTTTAVELTWNGVAGATDYVVTQNEDVIYSGPATEFTAPRPVPGMYTYQVAAHDGGRVSDFSRNSEQVDVFMTWGELQPIADLYHDLIPATPLSTNGFDAMRCWGEDGDLAFSSSKRTVSCTRDADAATGDDSGRPSDPGVPAYQVIVDTYETPEEAVAAAKVTAHDLRGVDYTTAQGHTGTLYLSDKQRDQGQAILTFDDGDHARSVVWVVVPGEPAAAAGDVLRRLPI